MWRWKWPTGMLTAQTQSYSATNGLGTLSVQNGARLAWKSICLFLTKALVGSTEFCSCWMNMPCCRCFVFEMLFTALPSGGLAVKWELAQGQLREGSQFLTMALERRSQVTLSLCTCLFFQPLPNPWPASGFLRWPCCHCVVPSCRSLCAVPCFKALTCSWFPLGHVPSPGTGLEIGDPQLPPWVAVLTQPWALS